MKNFNMATGGDGKQRPKKPGDKPEQDERKAAPKKK